jgi:MFS family permease
VLPVLGPREAWRIPAYRASLVAGLVNGWGNFGVRMAILPLFAAGVISHEPWVAGLALATFAAGNAAGLSVSGRWSDRRGRRPFIIGGLLVSGLGLAVTGLTDTLPLLLAVSVVAGIGTGTLSPAQQAALADIIGRERNGGPALARYQMATDAGTIAGPLVAGVLIDRGSYALAFAVTGLVVLAAVPPWWRTPEPRRPAGGG